MHMVVYGNSGRQRVNGLYTLMMNNYVNTNATHRSHSICLSIGWLSTPATHNIFCAWFSQLRATECVSYMDCGRFSALHQRFASIIDFTTAWRDQ